jgi:hypothetical protein
MLPDITAAGGSAFDMLFPDPAAAPLPTLPMPGDPRLIDMVFPGPTAGAGGNNSAPLPTVPMPGDPRLIDMMLPGPAAGAGGNPLLSSVPGSSPMPIPSSPTGMLSPTAFLTAVGALP